jgi:hypothetical protein
MYAFRSMIFHMKTTLIIPDEILRELKKRAAEQGQTLSDVVANALQRGLSDRRPGKKLKKLPTYKLGRAKVNVADRDQLYRAMEGK